MVKMLKLGRTPGPCNICGATGLVMVWDSDDYEPCQACRGTGHNAQNLIVLERETKNTKFEKKCDILIEAWHSAQWDENSSEWGLEFCNSLDYHDEVTPGIFLAMMWRNGHARTKRARPIIEVAFEHLLNYYNWKHDMGFKSLDDITPGGQYWSEADD